MKLLNPVDSADIAAGVARWQSKINAKLLSVSQFSVALTRLGKSSSQAANGFGQFGESPPHTGARIETFGGA